MYRMKDARKYVRIYLFLFNFTWFSFMVSCSGNKDGPTRRTLYGVIGGKMTSRLPGKEVEEYLGVPYAAPPVGPLRFKYPQPPVIWSDILETKTLSSACIQDLTYRYIDVHREDFNKYDEDCLYMNIYVPKIRKKSLPVLLYVHGGSNLVGMGAMLDGDILAAHGEIIVVTFNYRLGFLGFYADKQKGIEGIYGLLDQIQAMKWVNENIHFFDGDPSKVTLHGHSLGAADVGLHTANELTRGLFRYAIIHSGSPIAHWFISDCVQSSRKRTYPSDCKPGTSRFTNRRPAYKELMEASVDNFASNTGEDPTFASFPIIIDGYYIKESPEALLKCNNNTHVESMLLAMTRDELFPTLPGREFNIVEYFQSLKVLFPGEDILEDAANNANSSLKFSNNSTYSQEVARLTADLVFFIPMVRLADVISEWMEQVYLFSFQYVSQDPAGPSWQGVPHGWDLFYIFGVPLVGHHIHNYTERDRDVSKATMTLFSNYIKHGYMSINGADMKSTYDSKLRNYYKLDFDNGHTAVTPGINFKKPQFEFWKKYLYAYDYLTCNKNNIFHFDIYWILCGLTVARLFCQ